MIQVRGLSKSFERKIISDFSIEFTAGKTSVILGPSGCGKTTLFNILSGLDRDYRGEISIDNRVSYIFQEDRLIPWLTARENLELVQDRESRDRNALENILKKFHLSHRRDSMARDLSGGEKQRLSIARAFLHRSNTLLMDEALRSMDLSLKLKIIEEINTALKEYKKTMVVISHDIREALLMADTIYVMEKDPMRIADTIDIHIPKEERNLYDEEILHLEKRLYTLLLK
ncbi:ABC transporter ATP-binding protein [Propionigenium maris DSM 9537]|uniref:ABC transporter ATP-binding protein n=1 Tax=Propionigenium maris DSM 9537 TaxID=1123000 RepID=A0A9W6GMA3_9FUSO|nr:ABC transporter ATP-binding protein [Propionigenium maris]GLI56755.1 ABC transporter ATP-binding protein [Propionigenium maris DSM 9537]